MKTGDLMAERGMDMAAEEWTEDDFRAVKLPLKLVTKKIITILVTMMKIKTIVHMFNSKRDRAGNCYWSFQYSKDTFRHGDEYNTDVFLTIALKLQDVIDHLILVKLH